MSAIHLWTPLRLQAVFGSADTVSDAAICPAFDAAVSCWPVWEFADRNHITNSVLEARWKALVLPAPSRRLLCHTLLRPTTPPTTSGPPWLTPGLRPELCNPLRS